jgi:hypothetical protein
MKPKDTQRSIRDMRATIEIPVYETPSGRPTCCRDFEAGEICRFLRAQRMGFEMTCLFAPSNGRRNEPLEYGPDGYLVPSPACPFHSA